MASVRANQIAQEVSALEEPQPTAMPGRDERVLVPVLTCTTHRIGRFAEFL
jgi:hypothetical protein